MPADGRWGLTQRLKGLNYYYVLFQKSEMTDASATPHLAISYGRHIDDGCYSKRSWYGQNYCRPLTRTATSPTVVRTMQRGCKQNM